MKQTLVSHSLYFLLGITVPYLISFIPFGRKRTPRQELFDYALLNAWVNHEFSSQVQKFSESSWNISGTDSQRESQRDSQRESGVVDVAQEIGYTIESQVPHAFYLHQHGRLSGVRGPPGLRPYFPFTTNYTDTEFHQQTWLINNLQSDNPYSRVWSGLGDAERGKWRNVMRTPYVPIEELSFPDFPVFYKSNVYVGKRPLAIVTGKHSGEWGGGPLNTYSKPEQLGPILDTLIEAGYHVVYIRVTFKSPGDRPDQIQYDPGDVAFVHYRYRDRVTLLDDVTKHVYVDQGGDPGVPGGEPGVPGGDPGGVGTGTMPATTAYNIVQLLVLASAKLFVNTQGGNAVISSVMDGRQFIYHVYGSEYDPATNFTSYPRLALMGGMKLSVHTELPDLLKSLKYYCKTLRI